MKELLESVGAGFIVMMLIGGLAIADGAGIKVPGLGLLHAITDWMRIIHPAHEGCKHDH